MAAPVRVQDATGDGPAASGDGGVQGGDGDRGLHAVGHGVADDPVGPLVFDGAEVQPSFSQYLSIAYSEHLDAAGIKPSTGAVGSSYDNALAETINGLYKTELIKPRRPWRGIDDLEIATAEWVDRFNHRRPYEYCDDLTPVEAEQAHYRHHQTTAVAAVSNQ